MLILKLFNATKGRWVNDQIRKRYAALVVLANHRRWNWGQKLILESDMFDIVFLVAVVRQNN